MSTFSVFSYLDPALIKEEMGDPYASKTPAVWPSEASAERVDKSLFNIVGKCHRAAFMRMTGFSVTNPADATSAWKWVMGREIESNLTNQAQMAGIFASSGVKHFVRDIVLSLEFDVIAIDPLDKRGWILECKSYSGYYAKKEIETMNKPKLENLMQVSMYILEARNGKILKAMIKKSLTDKKVLDKKVRDLKKQGKEFTHRNRCEADRKALKEMSDAPIGAKLLYVDRDSASRKEFTIEIFEDLDGYHYPMVDGVPFKIFTLESIYTRYKTLQGYWFRARSAAAENLANKGIFPPPSLKLILCPQDVVENELIPEKTPEELTAERNYLKLLEEEVRLLPPSFWPPAEYEWSYSPERVEQLFQGGQIGKTKYGDYKKDKIKRLGDWQCSYCSTAGHCLKERQPELQFLVSDLLADMSAEVEIG
jgi:hypothetical protein